MHMEQVYKQWKKWKKYSSSGIYKTRYYNDSIYCYLERENYKVLKFEINASLF